MAPHLRISSMSHMHSLRFPSTHSMHHINGSANCSSPSRRSCPYLHHNSRGLVARCSLSSSANHPGDFFSASILISETLSHHSFRNDEYKEVGFGSPSVSLVDNGRKSYPFADERRHSKSASLGINFLNRFKTPTVFLKVSCEKDFLLPIIVGEYALENLINQLSGKEDDLNLDQYHLLHNIVAKLEYQVTMLMITKRVANTYFARLCFGKPGNDEVLSVDIRPSDGLVLANLLKIPICVNKNIVYMDAITISSAMGKWRDLKASYDVTLDSAGEGEDSLAEELQLVKNMNAAAEEERFKDAALWRRKLMDLLKSRLS